MQRTKNKPLDIYNEQIPILVVYAAGELISKEYGSERRYKSVKELKGILEATIDEVCEIQQIPKKPKLSISLETLKEVLEFICYENKNNPELSRSKTLYLYHGLCDISQKLSTFLKFGAIFPKEVNKLAEFCSYLSRAAKVNSIAKPPQKYTLTIYL